MINEGPGFSLSAVGHGKQRLSWCDIVAEPVKETETLESQTLFQFIQVGRERESSTHRQIFRYIFSPVTILPEISPARQSETRSGARGTGRGGSFHDRVQTERRYFAYEPV